MYCFSFLISDLCFYDVILLIYCFSSISGCCMVTYGQQQWAQNQNLRRACPPSLLVSLKNQTIFVCRDVSYLYPLMPFDLQQNFHKPASFFTFVCACSWCICCVTMLELSVSTCKVVPEQKQHMLIIREMKKNLHCIYAESIPSRVKMSALARNGG